MLMKYRFNYHSTEDYLTSETKEKSFECIRAILPLSKKYLLYSNSYLTTSILFYKL